MSEPRDDVDDDLEDADARERVGEPRPRRAEPVFDIIRSDHRAIEDLFEQIDGADGDERTALIERCVQELMLHAIAEEETLYAHLRDVEDLRPDVLEGEVEHALFERLAAQIMSGAPDDELCDARLMVLRDLVEHHIEAEEEELLPAAESLLDRDTALTLGLEMQDKKAGLVVEGLDEQLAERDRV